MVWSTKSKLSLAERALRKAEARYQSILDAVADPVTIYDMEGRVRYINPAFTHVFGWILDELKGKRIDFVPEENRPETDDAIQRMLRGETIHGLETRRTTKEGRILDIQGSSSTFMGLDGKPSGIVVILRDVTEKRRMEEALKESEARYRSVLEAAPDPVAIYNMEGRVRYLNTAFTRIFGWSLDELKGKRIDFVPEENRPETDDAIQRMLRGETIHGLETRRTTKEGRILDIQGSSSTFMGLDGKPSGSVVILRDVTEKRRMEEALKESQERYHSVMEAAPDPMVVYSMDGKVNYLNPAFTRVFGWKIEELLNRKIDFVPQECWPETNIMIRKAISGEGFSDFSTRRYTKDKKILDISISAATWRDKNGIPVGSVVNLRDVTQRKRMEEARNRSSKLESLGILAGGIAHDFNNLLTIIIGGIDLSLVKAQSGSKSHKNLTTAYEACMRAIELTNRFLTFAKGGLIVKELGSLADTIQSSTVRALEGSNISCDFSIPKDLWHAEFDKGQINQVIANLIQNVKDTMPEGGTIKVGAENIDLNEGEHHLPFKKGFYVKIYFQDEGHGIPEEQVPKIFDPYYSTKDLWTRKGMGLGLATVFSIVERHEGYIQVDSKVDVGTTFSIFLCASTKVSTSGH